MNSVTKETAEAYENKWAKRDIKQLRERIKQLQAELAKVRWIPVSEGLPEDDNQVNIVTETMDSRKRQIIMDVNWGNIKQLIDLVDWKTITHWMLKPTLPDSICNTCSDTGEYHEQHDGGASTLFCDCDFGQKKQREFEEKNPDCKPLTFPEGQEVSDESV